MFEDFNHGLFQLLSAPNDLSAGPPITAPIVAEWAILAGPALLAYLWVSGDTKDRRAAIAACLSGLLALAVSGTVSSLYFHPRPFMDGLARNILQHAADSSFPSDHAALLFALGWSLMFTPPARFRRSWIMLTVIAFAVGWSRIYLGVHYPLDVVGAAIVALAAALVVARGIGARASASLTDLCIGIYNWPLAVFRSGRQAH